MKFLHLSDLHLGIRVNEFSLLEDQKHILSAILAVAANERPDAVLIAGDVYDKSAPSAEAVELFDRFLTQLAERGYQVFVVSGNHDSPERIAFGARLMDKSGVHLSPVYRGPSAPAVLYDGHGPVYFHMLPFIKPVHVRRVFPDEQVGSYTDALRIAVGSLGIDPAARNVLIAHQFVTGASRSESEEISVGGADNVDASVFDGFDYVALGHLHIPQNVGSERIRYAGSPLKYSFSEAGRGKSVTVVTMGEKGKTEVRAVPLVPKRDMRVLRGTYAELTAKSSYEGTATDDYLRIVLTDEEDVPEAFGRLRAVYPNLMKLEYDNARVRSAGWIAGTPDAERMTPLELFGEFYALQNGRPLGEAQKEYAAGLMETIWEGKE